MLKTLPQLLNDLSTLKKILIIVIIGFSVYFNSLLNDFVLDDHGQILENISVHSIGNIPKFFTGSTFYSGGNQSIGAGVYYKPLTTTILSLIYSVSKNNVFLYHLIQILLHVTNAVLIFIFFRVFFEDTLSLLLASVFLVHPLNVESVVYISTIQESLFFVFGILALLSLKLNFANNIKIILLSLLILLSTLSKETGILFLIIIPIFCYLFKRKFFNISLLSSTIAFLIYIFLRIVVASNLLHQNAIIPIMLASLIERTINIPKIVSYYLNNFFFPKILIVNQSWIVKSVDLKNFYIPLIFDLTYFISIIALGLWIWKKAKEYIKPYVFFATWFIFGLILHLQIFPLDNIVADRWFYFPMIGLLGLSGLTVKIITKKSINVYLVFTFILIISAFSMRTFIRNSNWRNGITLLSHDIAYSEDSNLLENSLGAELFVAGKYEEAQKHFEKSVEIFANSNNLTNLGVSYAHNGQVDEAKKAFQQAIDLDQYYLAYQNMAGLMLKYDDPKNTANTVDQYLKIFPYNSTLWYVLALSEYQQGNNEAALTAAKQAYILEPNVQDYYILYSRLSKNLPVDIKF